jgi:hypothetical protein
VGYGLLGSPLGVELDPSLGKVDVGELLLAALGGAVGLALSAQDLALVETAARRDGRGSILYASQYFSS